MRKLVEKLTMFENRNWGLYSFFTGGSNEGTGIKTGR